MQNSFRFLTAAPLAAVLLLGACNSQPETITAGDNDPDAKTIAAAPPVQLPPMVTASRTYRCKDNSLVYIDFFNNGTAQYKAKKDAPTGVTLTAPEQGKPYVAEGYSVSGDGTDISLTAPGRGATSCKA